MKVPNLRALSALPLAVSVALSASAETTKNEGIPALIDQLVEVESTETFYAGTFRYKEFPPVDQAPLGAYPPASGASRTAAAQRALIRLVESGPEALPYLLAHLNDNRETKTSITDDYAKSMGPSSFVSYREGNALEEITLEDAGLPMDNPGPDFDGKLDEYTLTVGDMCFTLIGMISNRSYYILVDEFGAQLNSPTRSERMVVGVRELWGSHPEAIDLYGQLKSDLESGNEDFANSAAMRLLYYFPSISDNLIIARLGKLISAHRPGSEALADYLEAISWTTEPRIMSTLRRFLQSTTDASAIGAAARVYGTARDSRGHEQLAQLADRLKLRRDPAYVQASRSILELNLLTYPTLQTATLRRFLNGAGTYANTSACLVCEKIDNAPLAPLVPLLVIKSKSTGDRYLIKGEGAEQWPEDDDYVPYRVCDRAYETISRILGDKQAVAIGTPAEMDARIAKLARRLSGKPSRWSFSRSEIKSRQNTRLRRTGSN